MEGNRDLLENMCLSEFTCVCVGVLYRFAYWGKLKPEDQDLIHQHLLNLEEWGGVES